MYLGVEKNGMVDQLGRWFWPQGIPVLALGGYSSQTSVDDVQSDMYRSGRDAVLLYPGDFDPSGEDIDRDFVDRSDCWDEVVRVALTAEQGRAIRPATHPGKSTDSRAGAFIARHGRLVQVELDALPPDVLRDLFTANIDGYWDESKYQESLARERDEGRRLQEFAARLDESARPHAPPAPAAPTWSPPPIRTVAVT